MRAVSLCRSNTFLNGLEWSGNFRKILESVCGL